MMDAASRSSSRALLSGRKPVGCAKPRLRTILLLGAIWILPYAGLGLLQLALPNAQLGRPLSWFFGFIGLQLFATVGVVRSNMLSRALLGAAAAFYAAYLAGVIPGLAPASSVAPQLCIAALMALSVWLPFSSGQLSLAQAGFMAIGAYGSAWLTVKYQWPFAVALPAAALATAGIGLLASYPALRLRGVYLALATLGFGEVVRIFFLNFEPTGGAFGFPGIPKHTTLVQMLITLATVVVLLFLMMRSRIGRAIAAVRQDALAAAALGVDVTRIRTLTFTLGALLAGLAGGFQAHYVRFISPENYGLPALIEWLAAVMLGGFGTFLGPLAGTLVVSTTPELMRFLFEWRLAVYGVILVALLLLRPEGIITRNILGWSFTRGNDRGDQPSSASPIKGAMERTAEALLTVRHVSKSFGAVAAVDDVSFSVRPGTIHALIGPNGAGKTTLFNIITGMQAASRGEILLGGRPIHNLRAHEVARSGIARTFQNIRLFGDMTVLENVMLGGHVVTRSGLLRCMLHLDAREERDARSRARRLLAALGLADYAERPAGTLSYGDQRRVEVARALASDPVLLLLDEPAAGMNAAETAAFGAFVRRIVADFHKTVLIVEHDMALVMGLCDHVTALNFGTLIADGPPREVQQNQTVIDAYLGRPCGTRHDIGDDTPPVIRRRQKQARAMLHVDQVVAGYDHVEALRGISLSVSEGEIVALIGANGAGKTTTLLGISGLLRPTSGKITFRNEVISTLPPQAIMQRGISHVVEGRGIFARLTVAENLTIGAYRRRDNAVVRRDLDALLSRFPRLAERRGQLAGTLSGGEQQMLAIARALMSQPRLLLLDEPSMGLAPAMVDKVFEVVRDINRQGTAILLVEQNAALALELADRAYVMATGQIVASGEPQTLIADEKLNHAYLGVPQGATA